jgi:hypothetical protein
MTSPIILITKINWSQCFSLVISGVNFCLCRPLCYARLHKSAALSLMRSINITSETIVKAAAHVQWLARAIFLTRSPPFWLSLGVYPSFTVLSVHSVLFPFCAFRYMRQFPVTSPWPMTSHLYALHTNSFGVHWSRLVLSDGSSWVEIVPSLHLITERDSVSEIWCSKKPMTLDSAHNNSHIYDHTVHPICGRRITSEMSSYYHDFRCVTIGRRLDWILDLMTTLYTPLGTTGNYSAIAKLHNSQFTTTPAKPFPSSCVWTSRSLATTSNSRDPPAACQLSTPELSVQFSGAGASCQLRRLFRFSVNWTVVKVEVRGDGQSVCLGVEPHLGLMTR